MIIPTAPGRSGPAWPGDASPMRAWIDPRTRRFELLADHVPGFGKKAFQGVAIANLWCYGSRVARVSRRLCPIGHSSNGLSKPER